MGLRRRLAAATPAPAKPPPTTAAAAALVRSSLLVVPSRIRSRRLVHLKPLLRQQLPEDELEDPAVAEVALFLRRVDPDGDLELLVIGPDGPLPRDLLDIGEPGDVERLVARQSERLGGLAVIELERQHAHAHQV